MCVCSACVCVCVCVEGKQKKMRVPKGCPVREGEPIEGSRTMRNRPYPVLKCSKSEYRAKTTERRTKNVGSSLANVKHGRSSAPFTARLSGRA